jgi:hypothetical protein
MVDTKKPDWATPNRLSLGREHPVRCSVPGCITILSIYNGSLTDTCWVHDPKIGARRMSELARSLAKL